MFIKNSRLACVGSLVLIIFALELTFGETKESRGLRLDLERADNLSSRLLAATTTIDKEDDNSNLAEDSGEEDVVQDGQKFSWKHHREDHSIYSHRSLMSTSNIEHHKEEPSGDGLPAAAAVVAHDGDDDYEALKTSDYAEKEWNLMFRALDSMSDGFATSMLHQVGKQTNLLDEVVSRLKPKCRRDIEHIKESMKKHKLWALRMVDSNGKLPSGISYGRFSSPGDYEECLGVHVDESVYKAAPDEAAKMLESHYKFHGKYCLLDFRLPLPPRPHNQLLSIHNPVIDLGKTELATTFPEIKNYSGYASVFYEVGYLHAVCLPSTCDVEDLMKSLSFALEGLHIIVNNTVDCEVKYEGQVVSWTKAQVISMTLMILLFVNATIATVAHYLLPKRLKTHNRSDRGGVGNNNNKFNEAHMSKSKLKRWAMRKALQNRIYSDCFSIQTNFERLTKPDPRGLTFVHYTRIVAMALTVITHTAGMGTLQAITKPADASNSEQIFRDLIPQMLANAFSSIQIFFFMAGFMLVISTYPAIKRDKGHISFVEYAIKRAIRLMPGLAATIGLNFLWPLIVDGPMLTYFTRVIVEPCESNWWRTMGFLSNFDHVEKMCLRHSYFSASDYQLHVMAFPLLILLYKQPAFSLAIAALLTVTGFVAQVIMVLTKTLMPFMMVDYIDKEAFFNVVHYIHHPVWNHMSAFFYGFIIGYFVVKQTRIDLSEKTIKRIWWTVLPMGIISIFAPYFWNHYKRPIYRWQMVLYVLFDRFILLTTCAWLSYASMVLARKKPTNKPTAEISKQGNLNLPNIVTLDQAKNQKETLEQSSPPPVVPGSTEDVIRSDRLTADSTATSIPRQRSSPNFLSSMSDADKLGGMRPAVSTVDLGSITSNDSKQPFAAPHNEPAMVQTKEPRSRPPPPVSNLNTLCLILSRLTFQLYLFNMVVLWVDVNHSKYFWFFSYYFIITKALAVYIASSLMAMVFFVTLESPCLTLYIMWVKYRAQSRANRRTGGTSSGTDHMKDSSNITNINVNSNPQNPKVSPDSLKQAKHGGGLQMRLGSPPQGPTKPTFSFIDLSGNQQQGHGGADTLSSTDNQTKM